jgi:hypothetical protein
MMYVHTTPYRTNVPTYLSVCNIPTIHLWSRYGTNRCKRYSPFFMGRFAIPHSLSYVVTFAQSQQKKWKESIIVPPYHRRILFFSTTPSLLTLHPSISVLRPPPSTSSLQLQLLLEHNIYIMKKQYVSP